MKADPNPIPGAEPAVPDQVPIERDVIRMRIEDIRQLFNVMDPSPFRERDIDPGAAEFIVGWVEELPRDDRELILEVELLTAPGIDKDWASLAHQAISNHFTRDAKRLRREWQNLLKRGRTSLLIGLMFLAVCFGIGEVIARLFTTDPFANFIATSLTIVGWVAMWWPLEIFLYAWWPIRARERLMARIARMDVQIKFAD